MTYFVEARGVRLKSAYCTFGKDWESPGIEPCEFEDEETAMMFYRSCVEDEGPMRVHAFRIRRAGENCGLLTWNDR